MEKRIQSTAVTFLMTVLMFAGIEVTARVWYFFRAPKAPVVRETNNTAPKPMNAELDSEDLDATTADSARLPKGFRWHPFVYWRRPPYDTPTMHVSAQGIRRTVQPFDERAKTKIYMFGGSTMWGTGVRDENTVPSLFAKRLSELGGRDFHVTNFGESAYVATQSLLTLMMELREGRVPRAVIFYEGINEVAAAHIQQRPGETQHEREIGFFENAPKRVEDMSLVQLVAMKSAAVKLLVGVARKIKPNPTPPEQEVDDHREPPTKADPQQLAVATVRTYDGVAKLVQALADQYGFKAYFFWQPSVFTKAKRSKAEEAFVAECAGNMWQGLPDLFARVNSEIRNHPPKVKSFADLQSVFAGEERNLYTDIFHLTEKGNAVIADRIAKTVAKDLLSDRTLSSVDD